MNTNYYDNDAERMMREEYDGDPKGCLWAFIVILLAAIASAVAIVAKYTAR